MRELARQGKRIGRVRVLSEPPSDYQRWELWGTSWHIEAGEEIRYMSRRRAEQIGLPLEYDWWLFDDERLIITRFTDAGEIAEKSLITDPAIIAPLSRMAGPGSPQCHHGGEVRRRLSPEGNECTPPMNG